MYFCLGKAVHAAEVGWYREATPFRFPPACKSKPAVLLNFTVVHSKNTSGPCAWAEEPVKVNHIISKHCTCELSFLYIKKKKKCSLRLGSEKVINLLVGRYVDEHVIENQQSLPGAQPY